MSRLTVAALLKGKEKRQSSFSPMPIIMLLLGILSTLLLGLLPIAFPESVAHLSIFLVLVPVLIAMVSAIAIYFVANNLSKTNEQLVCELRDSISKSVPTYTDHSGAALLVDSMLSPDYAMRDTLNQFDETTRNLVEGKLVDSLSRSVEEVMQKQVVPPIEASSPIKQRHKKVS